MCLPARPPAQVTDATESYFPHFKAVVLDMVVAQVRRRRVGGSSRQPSKVIGQPSAHMMPAVAEGPQLLPACQLACLLSHILHITCSSSLVRVLGLA